MNKVVVLDAGHGGTDPGATNGLHLEKDKALTITLEVGSLLKAQGVSVVYTRETDKYVSLNDRTAIENKAKANCCVSLHLDSAPWALDARGMTIWLNSKAPDTYIAWAKNTLAKLKTVGYETNRYAEVNKGYRDNPAVDYAWNRQTTSPSMLLELGFITNSNNLKDFDSKYKEYAIAIAKSICGFIGVVYVKTNNNKEIFNGQKLILPINNTKVTASWKTTAYKNRFGFNHYGVDMVSSKGVTTLYASGSGTVLACGYDSVLGNTIVVKYTSAYNRVTGKTQDVICRMWHMANIAKKKNQAITKDTKLGNYGNTGQYSVGAHLHIEFDTDTANPYYTPTLSGKSTYFLGSNYGANDKTMSNPFNWLHCKSSAPDLQTYTTVNDQYISTEDKTIANIT